MPWLDANGLLPGRGPRPPGFGAAGPGFGAAGPGFGAGAPGAGADFAAGASLTGGASAA
ncbi:hypothetical protein EDD34_2764 [Myceligenerans xiligouense]|uniref:Uncharacterized protein n=1 Tax=Myceligenerans xiligouense TaxID=253184 RepID=A0A3N4Z8C5_9MICO|nr:hypothetical protein EDD34_2764 [Myceligenerans xiligouense]